MAFQIFANHALGRGPARPSETSAREHVVELVPVVRSVTTEDTILAILRAPRGALPVDALFRQKEAELSDVFRALAANEARVLLQRLENPVENDAVASEFARLLTDRRQRLLAVLASAPRRAARRAS